MQHTECLSQRTLFAFLEKLFVDNLEVLLKNFRVDHGGEHFCKTPNLYRQATSRAR